MDESRRNQSNPHIVRLSRSSLPRQRIRQKARERVGKELRLPSQERVQILARPTALHRNLLAKVGPVRLVGKVVSTKAPARPARPVDVQTVETARYGAKVLYSLG